MGNSSSKIESRKVKVTSNLKGGRGNQKKRKNIKIDCGETIEGGREIGKD